MCACAAALRRLTRARAARTQVGYKYAAFGHDAYLLAPLGLACFRDRVLMKASCPTQKVSSYTRRLCKKGLKVGVVRQLKREDAAAGRGAVDGFLAGGPKDPFLRRLVGVFTASTIEANIRRLVDADSAIAATATVAASEAPKPKFNPFLRRFVQPTDGAKAADAAANAEHDEMDLDVNAFLMCVVQGAGDELGVALLEASTGEAVLGSLADDRLRSQLSGICRAHQPVEIILCRARGRADEEGAARTAAALRAHVADALQGAERHVRLTCAAADVDGAAAAEAVDAFFGPDEDWAASGGGARPAELALASIAKTLGVLKAFGLEGAARAFARARSFDGGGRCLRINSNAIQQLELVEASDAATTTSEHRCLLSLFAHTVTKVRRRARASRSIDARPRAVVVAHPRFPPRHCARPTRARRRAGSAPCGGCSSSRCRTSGRSTRGWTRSSTW